jgi:hypothetical protein
MISANFLPVELLSGVLPVRKLCFWGVFCKYVLTPLFSSTVKIQNHCLQCTIYCSSVYYCSFYRKEILNLKFSRVNSCALFFLLFHFVPFIFIVYT